jgi:UDP-GlcNAc:undecaprenyl-phosphate GlcNAc-1-phosphate transferase
MGDAGSTFLGFYLANWSLRATAADQGPLQNLVLAFWLLAIPWYDLMTVVVLRLSQGRSPFHADKQHLSHRLTWLGFSSPQAVGIIYLLALVAGVIGLVLHEVANIGLPLLALTLAGWWSVLLGAEALAHQYWNGNRAIEAATKKESESTHGKA